MAWNQRASHRGLDFIMRHIISIVLNKIFFLVQAHYLEIPDVSYCCEEVE